MTAIAFTAPTTSIEASALMGKTIACPDGIARLCRGYGTTGSCDGLKITLSLGEHDKSGLPEAMWSTDNGFELRAQRQLRGWDAEWLALPANARKLVETVFGPIGAREDRVTLKAGAKLLLAAKRRLIKRGLLEADTCSRCGGCGRYSYNQISGSTCFGCNGSGKTMPSTTAALRVAIRCE